MPILSIIQQPPQDSLNAAYRPVILRISATDTANQPQPPVVYCDVYVNGTYYKSIGKSKYALLNQTNSEWQFDIEDACQEVLTKYLGDNGGSAILKPAGLIAAIYCKFRSSGLDGDGLIQPEGTAPIQATGGNPAVAGNGTQSLTFFILNTALQHEDNQDIASHLSYFKTGQWSNDALPLSHRPAKYFIGKGVSDYFPIVYTGSGSLRCLQLNIKKKDGSTQSFTYCYPLPSCKLVTLDYSFQYNNDGTIKLSFILSGGQADHYTLEINDGAEYQPVNDFTLSGTAITYAHTNTSHTIRLTPYCDATRAGKTGIGNYTATACVPVTTNAYFFQDATVNMPYSKTIPLNGTPPFSVTPASQDWASFVIDGNSLKITGTPTQPGSLSISATVNNACGSVPVSGDITVNQQKTVYDLLGYLPAGNGKSLEMRCYLQSDHSNDVAIPFTSVIGVNVYSTLPDGSGGQTDPYNNITFTQGQHSVPVVSYPDGSRKIVSGNLISASPDSDNNGNILNTP